MAMPAAAGGDDKLAALLAGTYRDPESGAPVAIATEALVIEESLAGMERDLVASLGFGPDLAVVSDETTHAVLGSRVERALGGAPGIVSIVLPNGVHPDDATVTRVREATAGADALIAVGSGTINDLVKYASAADGKPYAVFATAPSMNGYTSVNAAITVHGHKMSLPAQAPRGAFFDLAVLAAAPARLVRAGLGDSLCRTTAQADWLLAHLLFDQPYRQLPFDLLKDDEPSLFAQSAALVRGDREAIGRLVRVLVLSGLGTAIVGNSQPASQGEHLVSHYIDMFADPARPLVFHGEQVGVTTLSAARLQEAMLAARPVFRPDTQARSDFVARYGAQIGKSCWDEFSGKRLDRERANALNDRVASRWDAIRERIAAILLPSAHLGRVLAASGAGLAPESIHLTRSFYEQALLRSREIRNRYTFFDVAADTGALPSLTAGL